MPRPPAPFRCVIRPYAHIDGGAFGLLLLATLLLACLYLSGAAGVERHDALYGALLAIVWGFFFAYEPLLKTRVLGPILARAGQAFVAAAGLLFFGFLYWLILSR
jgi:hypothetical protein